MVSDSYLPSIPNPAANPGGINDWYGQDITTIRHAVSNVIVVTTNTTLTTNDKVVVVNASGAAVTITLPAASSALGKEYRIIKKDTSQNTVTISPNGADTLNSAASVTLRRQWEEFRGQSDGVSAWIGEYINTYIIDVRDFGVDFTYGTNSSNVIETLISNLPLDGANGGQYGTLLFAAGTVKIDGNVITLPTLGNYDNITIRGQGSNNTIIKNGTTGPVLATGNASWVNSNNSPRVKIEGMRFQSNPGASDVAMDMRWIMPQVKDVFIDNIGATKQGTGWKDGPTAAPDSSVYEMMRVNQYGTNYDIANDHVTMIGCQSIKPGTYGWNIHDNNQWRMINPFYFGFSGSTATALYCNHMFGPAYVSGFYLENGVKYVLRRDEAAGVGYPLFIDSIFDNSSGETAVWDTASTANENSMNTFIGNNPLFQITTGSTNTTITLPLNQAAGGGYRQMNGIMFTIMKVDSGSGSLTLAGRSGATINGSATKALGSTQYTSAARLIGDEYSANWFAF